MGTPPKKPRLMQRVRATLAGATALLQSAVLWYVVVVLCAMATTLTGIYTLTGTGWTLICGGVCLFAVAYVLRMGITTNG